MERVCRSHGALIIFDEVMSGMGRCGTLHAWQNPDVGIVPDITTIGKGLGGGFMPIAALLIGARVTDALDKGTGAFMHGQTYQGHPVACAASLEVQKQVREQNLMSNVMKMGDLLENGLKKKLGDHPHVGDIRGKGLFWGVSSYSALIEVLMRPD
jgi:adenosylmethionine-8-amino-7-oxononanoate aminotransferase